MKAQKSAQTGLETPAAFMTRFSRNKAGNTIAMFAMALIPMVAMTGSAVDVGRGYLIKTRLQQACDAGVLAGRRAMAGNTYGTAEQAQARSYFRTNMSNGTVAVTTPDPNWYVSGPNVDPAWFAGATNVTFTTSAGANNEVQGSATARMPTSLMKMFGYERLDLAVNCNARLDISNTDVMMVLDVTGSMADCPDDSHCNGNSDSKIAALRTAVVNFYNTIRGATPSTARFRLGFVPYSTTVNLGTDGSVVPSGWAVTNWTYQSRVAVMDLPGWAPVATYGQWTQQTFLGGAQISNSNCNNYGNNVSFYQNPYSYAAQSGWNQAVPTAEVFQDSDPADLVTTQSQRVSGTWASGNQSCTRQIRTVTIDYQTDGRYAFRNWIYKPVTYDVTSYLAGSPVSVYVANTPPTGTVTAAGQYNMVDLLTAPGSNITGISTTFDGCFEERDTVNQASFSSIPSGAYDLRHDVAPTGTTTQWRPIWGELVYDRNQQANRTTNNSYSPVGATCPATIASKLADRDLTSVQTYVSSLSPGGATFHDLGMAWGLRMVSSTGIWGTENQNAPNGNPISRHIIFLTDGTMNADPTTYSSHGFEKIDRRTSNWGDSTGTLNSIHTSRFIAMCNAARADGISVWTIAFGTSNPSSLVSCADPGQSFVATDSAALQTKFQLIASRIAQLRLSQ